MPSKKDLDVSKKGSFARQLNRPPNPIVSGQDLRSLSLSKEPIFSGIFGAGRHLFLSRQGMV